MRDLPIYAALRDELRDTPTGRAGGGHDPRDRPALLLLQPLDARVAPLDALLLQLRQLEVAA